MQLDKATDARPGMAALDFASAMAGYKPPAHPFLGARIPHIPASHLRAPRITLPSLQSLPRIPREFLVPILDCHKLFFGQLFQIHQRIMRVSVAANKFIELHLHRNTVPVLGILNEEDHEKGDDRRSCIDHQLPRIAESEYGTRDEPRKNHAAGDQKRRRFAGRCCDPAGKGPEGMCAIAGFKRGWLQTHAGSVAPS